MLGGVKMWLIGFQILVLIMLYGLVTSTLWGFSGGSRVVPGVPGHHPKMKKDGRYLLG